MPISHLIPKPHPQTAGRVIDDEAVLILSDQSEIKVLNAVGARIYELADGRRTVAIIVEAIAGEFDVSVDEAAADVGQFLKDLVAQNVMVLDEPNEEVAP